MSQGEGGGRPLKFKSVAELQEKVDAYFAECDPHMEEVKEWVEARDKAGKLLKDENGLNYLVEVSHKVMTKQVPYTVTGLALALDTSRKVLVEYENGNHDLEETDEEYDPDIPRFSNTIKKAKSRVEYFLENTLHGTSPAGTIFNLKNNFGWKDKTETDITSGDEPLRTALVHFMGDDEPTDSPG